jgi:hypothetical protein
MNMAVSTAQLFAFVLTPGSIEKIRRVTAHSPNMVSWRVLTGELQYGRNAIYIGVALTAIGIVGAASSKSKSTGQYACGAVITLGTGLAAMAAKKLHDLSGPCGRALEAYAIFMRGD